jgi:fructuronate reductase
VRLSPASLVQLSASVIRPGYDHAAQKPGIVHFGIGAFHRAHQAVYTDDAMNAGDRDWGIIGVSLRSANVAQQMNPQDGLFTVTTRSGAACEMRLIGSVREVMVAGQHDAAILIHLITPTTHIITFTVTEKGYCRASCGSLDFELAEKGFYPILAGALEQRKAADIEGLTLLSCDNLAQNGAQLRRLLGEYLSHHNPALAQWVEDNCTFPSSMVDRIVPATTAADLDAAEAALGLRDEAHVITEQFSQWVIEDSFAGPRPQWEVGGAEFVSDVAPYETAKLRMLNGAHSALAYIGLKAGHVFVHQAIVDPAIRPLIERLMREEAAPSIAAAPGQDLNAYANALLARFENSALNHRLIQIAMDGSQKIPQRWLETLAWNQARGRKCPAIMASIEAWIDHLRGDNGPVDDPLAKPLFDIVSRYSTQDAVINLFGKDAIMTSSWIPA